MLKNKSISEDLLDLNKNLEKEYEKELAMLSKESGDRKRLFLSHIEKNSGSKAYANSIKRIVKNLELNIEIVETEGFKKLLQKVSEMDKATDRMLVLKGEEESSLFHQCKSIVSDEGLNIEGKLVQTHVVKATANMSSLIAFLEEKWGREVSNRVTVVGRSKDLGIPLTIVLLDRDFTVTVAHSKTKNFPVSGDILISMTGNRDYIDFNSLDYKAIIDVGYDFPDRREETITVGRLTTLLMLKELLEI